MKGIGTDFMNKSNDNKSDVIETPSSHRKTPTIPKKSKHEEGMEKSHAAHKRRMEIIFAIIFFLIAFPFILLLFIDANFRDEHATTILTAILSALLGFFVGKSKR
jgi:lipopolysaccharide/colanic/teichoic acid biosynthesis glycosyltransferase